MYDETWDPCYGEEEDAFRDLQELGEEWLADFAKASAHYGPTRVANHVVMFVIPPPECRIPAHRELRREVNRRIHDSLVDNGMLYPVRTAVRRDVKRADDAEYGVIVLTEFGKALLENFLKAEPSPTWVR